MYKNLLVTAFCVLLASGCCKKLFGPSDYELFFKFDPQVGWELEHKNHSMNSMSMSVKQGDTVLENMQQEEETNFEYTESILEVDGSKVIKEKLTVSKATNLVDGEHVPYGFEGETVIAESGEGGEFIFKYEDGSALSKEDIAGIEEIVSKGGGGEGTKDVLSPGRPIKVGETWNPDIAAVAMKMMKIKDTKTVDLENSKAELTFESIEERDGVDLAVVTGTITLHLYQMETVKFEKPIAMVMEVDSLVSTDPAEPYGSVDMKMTMAGETSLEIAPGQTADMTIGMRGEMDIDVKPVK